MGRGGQDGGSALPPLFQRRLLNRFRLIAENQRWLEKALSRYPDADSFADDWVSGEFDAAQRIAAMERFYDRIVNSINQSIDITERSLPEAGEIEDPTKPGGPGRSRRLAICGVIAEGDVERLKRYLERRNIFQKEYPDLDVEAGRDIYEDAEEFVKLLARLVPSLRSPRPTVCTGSASRLLGGSWLASAVSSVRMSSPLRWSVYHPPMSRVPGRLRGRSVATIAAVAGIAAIALQAPLPAGAVSATDQGPLAREAARPGQALQPARKLLADVRAMRRRDLRPPAQRKRVPRLLRRANRLYRGGRHCRSVRALNRLIRVAGRLKPPSTGRLVLAGAWEARSLVLEGVGRRARCADPRVGRKPKLNLRSSDNRRLEVSARVGQPELNNVRERRRIFAELDVPGLEEDIDAIGKPSIPHLRTLIAIPHGARATIDATHRRGRRLALVPYPVQDRPPMAGTPDDHHGADPPPDEVFAAPPFAFDKRVYRRKKRYPAGAPCTVEPAGEFRGVSLGVVECAMARFHPRRGQVTVFGAIDFEVRFRGGSGTFMVDPGANPFQGKGTIQATAPLNRAAVTEHVADAVAKPRHCTGEELVVITHEAVRDGADAIAEWKNAKGIPTSVFTVNDGAGPGPDTPEAIQELVAGRHERCAISPSYVLLFGDAEYVPTFYLPHPGKPEAGYIATDWPYTQLPGLPPGVAGPQHLGWEFAVGRIPVDPEHAEAVAEKLIAYERDPPPPGSFYGSAGIASQFDCCRFDEDPDSGQPIYPDGTDRGWFIGTVEDLRTALIGEGYSVDRIYERSLTGAYQGNPTPLFYRNGTPLPPELQPPFQWDGSTAGVTTAFNEGRSIMAHLDHGWSGGWVHPTFDKNDAANLTNGAKLPFVLSFNCASGYFDNETDGPGNDPNATSDPTSHDYTSWVEEMIRNLEGGAMGAIAATRTTYAHGNIMMKGALDSAMPDIDPFGGPTPNRRIGDMLNHARLFMLHKYGGGNNTTRHWYLYNLHGDPTAELWTGTPFRIRIPEQVNVKPELIEIFHPVDGTVLTAWQQTDAGPRPIGRARVQGGRAEIAYFQDPIRREPLQISADLENGIGGTVATVPVE